MNLRTLFAVGWILLASLARAAHGSEVSDPIQRLDGIDGYMKQIVQDWNVPGIGVGVVVKDKLVFAKGYGYRDYGKKLPFTPTTVFSIGSNTKLFTAVAAGLLVEEGKLGWDEPIRRYVPSIQFYDDQLNDTVTLRDMLAHRTGITRHDAIWYQSDFTRKELFERLRYLEPARSLRQSYLYNNMMYGGLGYVVELQSGSTWEAFVRERLFAPLGMTSAGFSIDDLLKAPDHAVPFTERRDSSELYELPHYRETAGIGPAGSIHSNLEDLSKWLIVLMNNGKLGDRTVIPPSVLQETMRPTIAVPNTLLDAYGYSELLNPVYGMGRMTASYRGHLLVYHGGDLQGFHAQVSMMPHDGIGVIVFVIGDHAAPLRDAVSYNIYERLLGLTTTPWSERLNEIRKKNKQAGTEARAKAGTERVAHTKPAHPLDDYVGEFEHPAYGVLMIARQRDGLVFDFHKIRLPLAHFHFERFDTPNDERYGKWSVNFSTNPQGDVDKAWVSLDEAEVAFVRRVPAALSEIATLRQYVGTYQTPSGRKFQVVLGEEGGTLAVALGGAPQVLIPWKPHRFKVRGFSDVQVEFVISDGQVSAVKQTDPSGVYTYQRK